MSRRFARPHRRARFPLLLAGILLAVASSLSGAASLTAQDEGEAVTLRLKASRGDASLYRFEQDIDLQMPPEFGGGQKVHSMLVVRQFVEEARGDTIRYLAEVRDLAVEMDRAPAAPGFDVSQFKGQRFRLLLNPRGEVIRLEPTEQAEEAAAQFEQSLRQVGFPVLPERPVRVGETWVDTTRLDAAAMALPADGEIVSVNRATLQKLSRSGDALVAELRVETEFRFEPGEQTVPGMSVEVTGSRSDDVRFDVTRGRFLDSRGTQDFLMTMAIPGASGSLSIEGTAKSRASLVRS